MAVKLNSRSLYLSCVMLLCCTVLGLTARAARADDPDPTTPQAMPISCHAPKPTGQTGLRRLKGDSNTWVFEITTDPADNVHWVEGPNWNYPGEGANAAPDWGLWNGGDGEMSLSWISPQRSAAFSIGVTGKITCGTGGGGGEPIDIAASWAGEVQDVVVTFAPDPVKTGFDARNPNVEDYLDIKTTVTATVAPKEEADEITFAVSEAVRVNLSAPHVEQDAEGENTGKITFEVRGVSATPADKPEGDTTIEAKKDDKVVGKVQAIVIVPTDIGAPYAEPEGTVQGVNMVLDKTTSPYAPYNPPQGQYATVFLHWIQVRVVDQFGQTLHSMYDGASIYEDTNPINQKVNGGVYTDPVGLIVTSHIGNVTEQSRQAWKNEPNVPFSVPNGGWLPLPDNHTIAIAGHPIEFGRQIAVANNNPAFDNKPNFVAVDWLANN